MTMPIGPLVALIAAAVHLAVALQDIEQGKLGEAVKSMIALDKVAQLKYALEQLASSAQDAAAAAGKADVDVAKLPELQALSMRSDDYQKALTNAQKVPKPTMTMDEIYQVTVGKCLNEEAKTSGFGTHQLLCEDPNLSVMRCMLKINPILAKAWNYFSDEGIRKQRKGNARSLCYAKAKLTKLHNPGYGCISDMQPASDCFKNDERSAAEEAKRIFDLRI